MRSDIKKQLEDVFGGGGQMAPGGTAAVLVTPSGISMELAAQAVRKMSMDRVFRDIGAIAAREVANELESQGLRPADYANLEDLPRVVGKRITSYLLRSEEFSRALLQALQARG